MGVGFGNLSLLAGSRQIGLTILLLIIALLFPNTSQIMTRYRPALGLEQLANLTTRVTWQPAWLWARLYRGHFRCSAAADASPE